MRYVTHYEQYPIYEPAEGGYYYAGNQITEYERMSKRAAKRELKELFDILRRDHNDPEYPWVMSLDENMIYRGSKYIGDGESYGIERKLGRRSSGRVAYC